jgi:hypothetical protein
MMARASGFQFEVGSSESEREVSCGRVPNSNELPADAVAEREVAMRVERQKENKGERICAMDSSQEKKRF